MNWFTYLLQGFGYSDKTDFISTIDKNSSENLIKSAVILGTIRECTESLFNMDAFVILSFVFLIIAEWHTGIKVDILKRGEKFKSRKVGRMILKIGTYIFILYLLSTFANKTASIDFFQFFDVNPMQWLYYVVFTWIILQLLVSYFENLAALGYKEMKGIVGFILRKGNQWFDFDGNKNGDELFTKKDNNQDL
ncbi:phage holin family protein [Myroides fluvii]|uniref:phage holin family protein n=1 Tax=Myroides fluvii TaxID=2572594 RepID=UPI00131B99AE|nr:phage holin family protein [Myroides fluvii]